MTRNYVNPKRKGGAKVKGDQSSPPRGESRQDLRPHVAKVEELQDRVSVLEARVDGLVDTTAVQHDMIEQLQLQRWESTTGQTTGLPPIPLPRADELRPLPALVCTLTRVPGQPSERDYAIFRPLPFQIGERLAIGQLAFRKTAIPADVTELRVTFYPVTKGGR